MLRKEFKEYLPVLLYLIVVQKEILSIIYKWLHTKFSTICSHYNQLKPTLYFFIILADFKIISFFMTFSR